MRSSFYALALFTCVAACSHAKVEPAQATPEPDTAPSEAPATTVELEPEPEPTTSPAPQLEPKAAFFAVYEALRAGDWAQFERFAGAPISYRREQSIAQLPPDIRQIASEDARAWLAELSASWAPSCNENPDPPCLSLNPLSLGVDDPSQIELSCAEPRAEQVGVICCGHQPMLLHNTPFLVDVCFDAEQRVTQVSLLDG